MIAATLKNLRKIKHAHSLLVTKMFRLSKKLWNSDDHLQLVKEERRLDHTERRIRDRLKTRYPDLTAVNPCDIKQSGLDCLQCTGWKRKVYSQTKSGVKITQFHMSRTATKYICPIKEAIGQKLGATYTRDRHCA